MNINKQYVLAGAFLGIMLGLGLSQLTLKGNNVDLFASSGKRFVTTAEEAISVFPRAVEAIRPQVEKVLNGAKNAVDALVAVPSEARTYKNTIFAISEAKAPLRELAGILEPVDHVHPLKEMREEAMSQRAVVLQAMKETIDLNRDLYDAVMDYVNNASKKESLTLEENYYLAELLGSFKRSGVDKSADVRERLSALNKALQEVSNDFSKAIANANAQITATVEELAGASEGFVHALARNEKGECIVPCNYPEAAEVMAHCTNPEVRKRFQFAFSNRGYPENKANLLKLEDLRDQFGQAQGYKNFSEYELATSTMAKSVSTVETFMKGLAPKAKAKLEKEVTRWLSDTPQGMSGTDKLYPWDSAYLMEYHRQKYYAIDDREVAKYFPMESTIKGLFSIYETFLGLKFIERSAEGAWHKDVRLMEIQKDGITRGYIFLDLFPRPFKYTHACFCPMIPAQRVVDEQGNATIRPMVGTIICNFPAPTADTPSLLKYDDASTFFHEFGHALHDVMGATTIAETGGCNQVKIDFVEMPSQMFEEWLNDKEMLKGVTKHYQTGEPMPDDMIDKLLSLVTFDSGYFISRQLRLSALSLNLFRGAHQDPDVVEKESFDQYMTPQCHFAPENKQYANFGHLTEYSCRYYGYLWSRVFALDLADYVRERGFLDMVCGARFGSEVLGVGAGADPEEILEKFLGRKPNQDAFVKAYGL